MPSAADSSPRRPRPAGPAVRRTGCGPAAARAVLVGTKVAPGTAAARGAAGRSLPRNRNVLSPPRCPLAGDSGGAHRAGQRGGPAASHPRRRRGSGRAVILRDLLPGARGERVADERVSRRGTAVPPGSQRVGPAELSPRRRSHAPAHLHERRRLCGTAPPGGRWRREFHYWRKVGRHGEGRDRLRTASSRGATLRGYFLTL